MSTWRHWVEYQRRPN